MIKIILKQCLAVLSFIGVSFVLGNPGENRVALVIGNNQYEMQPLRNAVADSRAIRDTLSSLGFEVVYAENVNFQVMNETLNHFVKKLQKDDVAFFFYAGHGVQVDGRNYLVPLKANPQDRADIVYGCLLLDKVLMKMQDRECRLNVLILDACRNNPFSRGFRDLSRGFVPMDYSDGSIIAFATAPGEIAADGGEKGNGLYTHYLLGNLTKPGLTLEQILKRTGRQVRKASNDAQKTWFHSSFYGDFILVPEKPSVVSVKPPDIDKNQPLKSVRPILERAISLYAGIGTSIDLKKSRELFLQAASSGDSVANLWLARMYFAGRGGFTKDKTLGLDLAFKHFEKVEGLAMDGDSLACFLVGSVYDEGIGMSVNLSKAFLWYSKAANRELPIAMGSLGLFYRNGWGVAKSDEWAVYWFRKATDYQFSHAQNNLGWMFRYGKGVPQSDEDAVFWYRKAAEQNYDPAQNNLGWMYLHGKGVVKSEQDALVWYMKSAEQNNSSAQNSLGWMYHYGRGVPQSDEAAVLWYRKAAVQGNATAQNNLGVMYRDGRGVTQSDEEAVFWYQKAEKLGNANAQFNLGWMFWNGKGVPKSEKVAISLYEKAAAQGLEDAQRAIKEIKTSMNHEN